MKLLFWKEICDECNTEFEELKEDDCPNGCDGVLSIAPGRRDDDDIVGFYCGGCKFTVRLDDDITISSICIKCGYCNSCDGSKKMYRMKVKRGGWPDDLSDLFTPIPCSTCSKRDLPNTL